MKALTGCVLLVLTVGVAQGLKCYTCDGASSFIKKGDCGDTYEVDKDHVRMCNATAGEMYCRKLKYGLKHVITSVTRECASECEEGNIIGAHIETCCKTDLCNAAPGTVVVSVILTLGAAILARVF